MVALAGIPNPRVANAVRALELLASDACPETAGAIRNGFPLATETGVDPEDLYSAGRSLRDRADLVRDRRSIAMMRSFAIAPRFPRQAPLLAPAGRTQGVERVHQPQPATCGPGRP